MDRRRGMLSVQYFLLVTTNHSSKHTPTLTAKTLLQDWLRLNIYTH